ncbi:hypothetical protein [Rodentibacter caecimuris]|uniref:Transferrin-binding protein B C-lobe/N-lobe beta barrel domain-containing protein n=1 Tax=Rodentibacter caecimuris TaxID=1796644 RepID=A0ABX3KZK0_9PAST|nr:hypothetical protein BKG89_01905 [Rodentibacter heylii]
MSISYKKTLVALSLSVLLAACSGGGGSDSSPTSQNSQQVPHTKEGEKTQSKSPQGDEKGSSSIQDKEKSKEGAMHSEQEGQTANIQSKQESSTPKKENGLAEQQTKKDVPSRPKTEAHNTMNKVQPKEESSGSKKEEHLEMVQPQNKPNAQLPRPQFISTGAYNFNPETQTLTVYDIQPEEDIYSNRNVKKVEKTFSLAKDDLNTNQEGVNYQFQKLGEGENIAAYYGYVKDSLDYKNIITNYVLVTNNNLKSSPAESFSANYYKQKGFYYNSRNVPVVRQGDVSLTFKNGKAIGSILVDGNPIFELSGNVENIVFAPTNDAEQFNISRGDKAAMIPEFFDSKHGQNDQKYLLGEVKTDAWQGILGAERSK